MNTVEIHARRVRRRTFILIAVEARTRQASSFERREALGRRRTAVLTELEREAQLASVPAPMRDAVVDVLDAHERMLASTVPGAVADCVTAYSGALRELARVVRRPEAERALTAAGIRLRHDSPA